MTACRSSVAAGCVGYILPPKAIARELARIARHPYLARSNAFEVVELAPAENNGLSLVFQFLQKITGVDFTHYRQTSIIRRIQRRMGVHKIGKMEDYVKYVQTNPMEIKAHTGGTWIGRSAKKRDSVGQPCLFCARNFVCQRGLVMTTSPVFVLA